MSAPRHWFEDNVSYQAYLQAHNLVPVAKVLSVPRRKSSRYIRQIRRVRVRRATKRQLDLRRRFRWNVHPMWRQLPYAFYRKFH